MDNEKLINKLRDRTDGVQFMRSLIVSGVDAFCIGQAGMGFDVHGPLTKVFRSLTEALIDEFYAYETQVGMYVPDDCESIDFLFSLESETIVVNLEAWGSEEGENGSVESSSSGAIDVTKVFESWDIKWLNDTCQIGTKDSPIKD